MSRYNVILRQKELPPLSDEEIAKVVAVAERDHARWRRMSHQEKLRALKPREARRPPSPSFENGEGERLTR